MWVGRAHFMFSSTPDDTVTDVGDCTRVSRPGLCGLAWYVAVDVVNDCTTPNVNVASCKTHVR